MFLSESYDWNKFYKAKPWLAALKQSSIEFTQGEIERFAWIAYKNSDFESAKEWLNKCTDLILEGKWVLAKLLLREGKIDEGIYL